MARIEDLSSSVGIGGPVDYAPSRPSQAFNQLGQQAAAAEHLLDQIADRDAVLEGASALADFRVNRAQRQLDLRTQAKSPDGFVDTALDDYDGAADQLISAHENPRVQAFLEQRLVEVRESERADSINWQAGQMAGLARQKAESAVNKMAIAAAKSPAGYESYVRDLDAMAEAAGLSPVSAAELRTNGRAQIAAATIKALGQTDPGTALQQLQSGRWDDALHSDARSSLIGGLQGEMRQRTRDAKSDFIAGAVDRATAAQAGVKVEPDARFNREAATLLDAQDPDGPSATAAIDNLERGEFIGNLRTKLAEMTPAEVMAARNDARGWLAKSGARFAVADVATVEREIEAFQKGVLDNPVAYAVRDPAYQERERKFIEAVSTGVTGDQLGVLQRDMARALVAAQDRMGVPKQKQRALDARMAELLALDLKQPGAVARMNRLRQVRAQFGEELWPTVLQDIGRELKTIAPETLAMLAVPMNKAGEELIATYDVDQKTLNETLTKEQRDSVQRSVASNATVRNYSNAMLTVPQNQQLMFTTRGVIEHAAKAWMAKGLSQSDAVERAAQAMLGQYRFANVSAGFSSRGALRVPAGIDADRAASAASALLFHLGRNEIASETITPPPDMARDDYVAGLRRSGRFLTDRANKGVYLYDETNSFVLRNGKPVHFTWDEMLARVPVVQPRIKRGFPAGEQK